MVETFRPSAEKDLAELIAWAAAEEVSLSIRGAGSKRELGRPVTAKYCLDMSGLTGITLYEPDELVLRARAGTPLADIQDKLSQHNQQLAFEPPSGLTGHLGTLGGICATNWSGPRRLSAGAARDHLLGFVGVSGRGEPFKSGGRVMKNVTGFDLSKLICGSFGTLAVISELTFKVLPAPETTRTVLILGLSHEQAVQAMTQAVATSNDLSGAAFLPKEAASRSSVDYVNNGGVSLTALRLEGQGPSPAARCAQLREILAGFGETEELHSKRSKTLWSEIRDGALLGPKQNQIWKISVPPSEGARIVDRLGEDCVLDWGGGLVWYSTPPSSDADHHRVREALNEGHATLFRADAAVRARVPVFQPQPSALADLTRRIKQGFDPKAILNPGRMYAGV